MKKYLLGIVAVVLAVGFSAFTAKHETLGKKFANPYWYSTNTAGTVLTASLGQNTKAAIITATGCDDTDVDFCARAYTSAQSLGTAPIPSADVLMEKQ